MRKLALVLALCISTASLFPGGQEEHKSKRPDTPLIAVSILPHQYAVEKIAGTHARTVTLVGPGQSPHSYEPTPRQMSALSQADAWILSHTDFEVALVPKISAQYPDLLLVDGTKGVKFRSVEEHGHEESDDAHDGQDEEHTEGIPIDLDRHTWLGREPMKLFASTVADTLKTLDPERSAAYQANLEAFHEEIDTLFETLAIQLAPLRDESVLVYHPSFGYFLDEFGISQEAVETGGKEPTAKILSELVGRAREDRVKAVFVQAQFPTSAAKNVAQAIGAEVVPLDPLAYDWSTNIKAIGEALVRSLRSSGTGGL